MSKNERVKYNETMSWIDDEHSRRVSGSVMLFPGRYSVRPVSGASGIPIGPCQDKDIRGSREAERAT